VRDGIRCFGAFGHRQLQDEAAQGVRGAAVHENDLVLDAEAIAEIAREMLAGSKD
jgi:hypothetical protein